MKQTSLTVHRFDRNINPAIGKVNVCLFCSEVFNHPNHIGYSPVKTAKQQAYLFFLRNAGSSYNPATQTKQQGQAAGARRLAKAERDARALGYTFEWQDDWEVGDHVKEFDCYTEQPATCETCLMLDSDGKVVQSLGCIDDATREYRRVVEAELALEEVSK